jgi:hypothetical protein
MSRSCGHCEFFQYQQEDKYKGYSAWGICKLTPERGLSQIKSQDDWCGQFEVDRTKTNNAISKAVSDAYAEIKRPWLFRFKQTSSRFVGFANVPIFLVAFLALGSIKFAVDLATSIIGLFP